MDEGTIKASILSHVRRALRARERPVITTEYSLGSSCVRADLAILGDEFIGIEIKSAGDTLRRLRSQLAAYARYFDRVVLVAAERHLKGIDEAWLDGAALWQLKADGSVTEVLPAAKRNSVSADSYIDLLTQQELRRFLKATPTELVSNAARTAFELAFKYRYKRTSDAFWSSVRRRAIRQEDVKALSRFAELRLLQKRQSEEKDQFWRNWVAQHEGHPPS
jgi:hypothetical protein